MRNQTKMQLKDIPGFQNYAITKDGRVWSNPRKSSCGRKLKGRWLKSAISSGYPYVLLCLDSRVYLRRIHQLVLETFIGPRPEGLECRHLDGNPLNNNLSNLCWGTHQENMQDKVQHKTSNRGERQGRSKLKERDVRMIVYMYRTGLFLQREIALQYNITQGAVTKIVNKKSWGHLWAN